jgi:S1-C subfamily serine protease
VPRDPSLGYFWGALAAAHAKAANRAALAASLRDAAARQLSPDEVNRLQGLAGEWKPGVDVAALVGPPRPGAGGSSQTSTGPMMIGTGFVVATDGYILTNAHVVPACKSISVRTPEGLTTDAALVTRDELSDLSLLKLAGKSAHVSTFREDRGVRQGDSVIAYGFPLAGLLSDQGNLTIGTVSALAGTGNDSHLFQISAPVQPGNSGGPLLDGGGNVIGVVSMKLNALRTAAATGDIPQNVNFAIKAGVARGFLDANGVDYRTTAETHELKTADVGDRAKKFTLFIECLR